MPRSATSDSDSIFPGAPKSANTSFPGSNFAGSWGDFWAAANVSDTIFSSSFWGISAFESERNIFIFAPENSRFNSFTASAAEKFSRANFAICRSSSGEVNTMPSENADTISFARLRLLRVDFEAIALSSCWNNFFFAASNSASEMFAEPRICLKFSASASELLEIGDSALNIIVRQNLEKSNIPAEPFVIAEPGVSETLMYRAFTAYKAVCMRMSSILFSRESSPVFCLETATDAYDLGEFSIWS